MTKGSLLDPHLPDRAGSWNGITLDNRHFANAAYGFSAPERRGVACRLIMATGQQRQRHFVGGKTKEFGKTTEPFLLMRLILNG